MFVLYCQLQEKQDKLKQEKLMYQRFGVIKYEGIGQLVYWTYYLFIIMVFH